MRRTATVRCASRRHVPAITIVIDAPGRIPAAFAVIDELTAERGLVTSEAVHGRPGACRWAWAG